MPDKRLIQTIREAFPLRTKDGGVIIDDPVKYHKLLAESGYKAILPNLHLENPSQNLPVNRDREVI